jgi:outer membrane immunogenic protein
MKMKFIAAIAISIAALASNVAMGADMPVRRSLPPPAPVAASWTGCYIGAGGGYGMANLDHSTTNAAGTVVFDIGHDNSAKGGFGTVGVGCDYQVAPNWVIGAFADWDFNDIKGRYSFNCPGGCAGPTGYIGGIKDDWAVYAGARVGYAVLPQLLAFVSAGWTEARFGAVGYVDASTGVTTTLTRPAQTRNGWFVGTGDEYAVGFFPGLFWKSEYRYAKYERGNAAQLCGGGVCGVAGTIHSVDSMRATVHTVRSALVWRFNMGGPSF